MNWAAVPALIGAVGFGAIAALVTDEYVGVRAVSIAIALSCAVFAGMAIEGDDA